MFQTIVVGTLLCLLSHEVDKGLSSIYLDSSLQKYLCLSPGVSCIQGWAQQASVDQLISQMVDQFKSSGQLAALETASDQQKAAICRCDTKYKISQREDSFTFCFTFCENNSIKKITGLAPDNDSIVSNE